MIVFGEEVVELGGEFLAGMATKDFFEPAGVGFGVFGGNNFDDVALVEFCVEADHFAVNFGAGATGADFAVEAVGEIERHGAFGEIDNVASWGIDEDFIGEEVEFELFGVDFFALAEFGGGFLEIFDPEEVARKGADAAFGVGRGEFLLVVKEGGGETAFGVIVHFVGADLELDDLAVGGDNGGMEGLVSVLLGHGDVIFDAAWHGFEEGMDDAEDEVAGRDIGDDEAEGDEVVDALDVLVVFGELFVEAIDRFGAAVALVFDTFFLEGGFDGVLGFFEFFVGLFEAIFGQGF